MNELRLSLSVSGIDLSIAALVRPGDDDRPPLICLHGFGSTKEDYADLALHDAFEGRALILYDAPGFGGSSCARAEQVTAPFLSKVAVADALDVDTCHVLGHSMGGASALLWAEAQPRRIESFFNIEGNLAPEDCFLSRRIDDAPDETPDAFWERFVVETRRRPEWGCRLYASGLDAKVSRDVVRPVFRSLVDMSDGRPLLDAFTAFPFPKAFVYGAQNASLSYLDRLSARGVALVEIAAAGHFPMYSNPQALWSTLAAFLDAAEAGGAATVASETDASRERAPT